MTVPAARFSGWKTSRYTRALDLDNGAALLYNGLTGAALELTPGQHDRLKRLMAPVNAHWRAEHAEDPLFEHLTMGGFVVREDLDELAQLQEEYERERQRSQFLLTIFPTFSCNFGCDYCFVGKKSGFMNEARREKLIDFAEAWLDRSQPPSMSVDWMGGEPLMALPAIESLSRSFMALCRAREIPYAAQVITNGSTLSAETASRLMDCGVNRLQVTLDGPREIHNQRRGYKHGKGSSFDDICEGLEHAVGRFQIRLRINVDEENIDAAFSLLDLFEARGWLGPERNFYPYLARITPFTEACANAVDTACSQTRFHETNYRWMTRLQELGVPVAGQGLYFFPDRKVYNCGAVGANGFVITPTGEVHKCGLTVDDSSEAAGVLGESLDQDGPNLAKWRDYSPFDNAGCRQCAYLPSCLGGCPRNHLDNRELEKTENCRFHQQFEDEILIRHTRLIHQSQKPTD